MITAEDIKKTILKGERLVLECKTAANGLPKSVWESYSAFANTIGGLILLGVDEHKKETALEKRFTFEGVSNPEKIITDFWNTINSDKVSANILRDHNTDVLEIDGKKIIYIEVPQVDSHEKPIFLNGNPYKHTFKRNHEGDFRCNEEEVRAMIRDANSDGNDGVLLESYTMDDIAVDSLKGYRNVFRLANNNHPWNLIEDDRVFLKSLGGYAVDRRTGKEGLTVAGLMMFGKGESVREHFANFRMDYLDMTGLLPGERYRYRLTYDGLWENNFFEFFRTVSNKLTFDMPCPFKLREGMQRIDDTLQRAAVREALTNSIIHCDVFMDAGILRIEKHDDYLLFRNPGLLKLPIEQVFEGGVSSARNPRVQHMLRMIGFGENIGSGFPKILHAWKEAGWPMPELVSNQTLNETKLRLSVPRMTERDSEKSSEVGLAEDGSRSDIGQTSVRHQSAVGQAGEMEDKILSLLRNDPTLSRAELARILKKAPSTIQRYTEKLKANGRIERMGGDFGGAWKLN